MKEKIVYELKSLYREPMQVKGYEFGSGEASVCIVGSTRGNEVQQLYSAGLLVQRLKTLEESGMINEGKSILVIPCLNTYSMNIGKRFWPTDNTDINRMFPGYDAGETTQRIAAGVFEKIKDYAYGIQFASYYMRGSFLPHIRMMKTGFEDIETAKKFEFPYVVTRNPRPFDTATLNYNWQIWETKAFSVYTTSTEQIDTKNAKAAVKGIEKMMISCGILNSKIFGGYHFKSHVINDENLCTIRCSRAGIYENNVAAGDEVVKGQLLARIRDAYSGELKQEITSPADGIVFFSHSDPLVYASTAVIKLVVGDFRGV
jgi:predicted deacylase